MRKALSFAVLAAAITLTTTPAYAQVESGHWKVFNYKDKAPPNGLGDNTTISIDQTPAGDYTGTFLKYNPWAATLQFITLNTDEGSTLYLVKPGDIISNATKAHLTSFSQASLKTLKVGWDFYLAVATTSFSDPGFSWQNLSHSTSFGWAHFKMNWLGKLTIVDSAMAFRETGIVVGKLQAAPQ